LLCNIDENQIDREEQRAAAHHARTASRRPLITRAQAHAVHVCSIRAATPQTRVRYATAASTRSQPCLGLSLDFFLFF